MASIWFCEGFTRVLHSVSNVGRCTHPDARVRETCGRPSTPAVTFTRSTRKIEDHSRGPGRVDCRAPDEAFGFERTPKPKIQRDPFPPKRKPYMWAAAVIGKWFL